MRRPGVGALRRGGFRGLGGGGGAVPPFPTEPRIRLRGAGITESSGDVASWDDIGSAALRFEGPTVGLRPALVAVGALSGAQTGPGGDYLASTAALQLVKPYVAWICLRVDTWVANRRILDFETSSYLAFGPSVAGTFRYEHGASDLTSTDTVADGGICQVTAVIAASGGTSALYVDAGAPVTLAGTAYAPVSRVVGLGATNTGTNPASTIVLEAGVWQFVDNTALAAFDLDALHAYGAHVIGQAGG